MNRFIKSMCTQTLDESIRNVNKSKPFGDVHILFSGNFHHLKPILPTTIYSVFNMGS